jgi:hypothetical protein
MRINRLTSVAISIPQNNGRIEAYGISLRLQSRFADRMLWNVLKNALFRAIVYKAIRDGSSELSIQMRHGSVRPCR